MNELEKAIREKIGNTDSQKARVWDKLQQKPRKNIMPYFVSSAFIVCLIIFFTMMLNGNLGESPPEQSTSLPTSIESPGSTHQTIPIVSSKKLDGTSISYTEDYVINLYSSAETYEQMTQALSIEQEPIDFSKHDVLLTQFLSDGCGLVVEQLSVKEQQLYIKLDLPEELRSIKELNCTTIAMPNTVLLVVPKLTITNGVFIEGKREIEPTFAIIETVTNNTLVVDENVEAITFTNPKEKLNFTFNDLEKIKEVTTIMKQAYKQPGIVNMASPEWRITMEKDTGEIKHYFLWLDTNLMLATLMTQEDTNTIYSLGNDMTVQLVDLIQNNAKDSVSSTHEIESIIHQYIEYIKVKKWDEYIELYHYDAEVKEDLLSFLKDSENQANNEGINTIQNLKLISMELTSDSEFSSKGDYVYDVLLDMKVHKTSEFYQNGISRHIFVFNETYEGIKIETVYYKGLNDNRQ